MQLLLANFKGKVLKININRSKAVLVSILRMCSEVGEFNKLINELGGE